MSSAAHHVTLSREDAIAAADAMVALHRAAGGTRDTWKKAELERFAQSRGWRVNNSGFYTNQLIAGRMLWEPHDVDGSSDVIDHRECFMLNRKPVAILSHTYGPWERCVVFALRHDLILERLPYSWYYPGRATAALFTRATEPDPNPKKFTVWLRAQSKRMDPVGDLARDYMDDCRVKGKRYSTEVLRSTLTMHGCLDAQLAFNDAMAEYQAQAVQS
jgi:hypothetical protein